MARADLLMLHQEHGPLIFHIILSFSNMKKLLELPYKNKNSETP